ncbi:30S ribosomal protein S12 methylthiotransferase RimO [Adlercreutzia murintestinalis]|uniref:30S ribosomal protein S12 methylthiotransferase RimO n=1 Tax=Adlercreutzia murintestinalis TaxID=2941325 RepID=UPI00203DDD37|nr:30S ribosomal protein S12 methylthiotransferase RimO [Adlercreutzia murintestinalis]
MAGNGRGVVCLCTLGCAKNEVDSEKMRRRLSAAGYTFCDDAAAADVVVVNTCSFIQAATEESIQAVLEAFELPQVVEGRGAVVVAGCMPARYGAELERELPEAAAFVPCADESRIVEAVDRAMPAAPCEQVRAVAAAADAPVFSYVKISDGCDRRCAYCTIPDIRGAYHSFPFDDIAADVRAAIEAGAREVVLVAQDTGRWGADLGERHDIAWLLATLADAHPETLFRIMYVQPDGVTDRLLETIATHENIASYLDVPIQHVDASLLRAMRRGGDRQRFEQLADHIRTQVPNVTLRTTLIAGFPGETEAQFDELLDFAASGCFDYVGVFPYSREEGTEAFHLEGQLSEDEKERRAQVLRDTADAASAHAVSQRCGHVERVLIEGVEEDGQLFGRTQQQAPEVDGVTYVDAGDVGSFVKVMIEDTLLYDMEGSVRHESS